MRKRGTVYFVGAGPGDPGLLTLRGADLLGKADCLLYDRLVGPELLRLSPAGCERIYVGKESAEGGRSQSELNGLICRKARRHQVVVRLKGGDPTLFGRISEEMEALSRGKIRFEIVPGVSSAWAAAALAGIPLTDRRMSSSVAVVTGQESAGKRRSVRWKRLAGGVDTLVILMGRRNLPAIARRLVAAGRAGSTPVALVRRASLPDQELLVSTLGRLSEDLKRHPGFGPPLVAIVGQVVRRGKGFGERPLEGKRILVTRPKADAQDLARRLERLGATCVHLPTIAVRPRRFSSAQARRLLERLPRYDWVVFTSHHGVEALERLARRRKGSLPARIQGRICAIGPRTAEAIRSAGLRADWVPERFSKEGIRQAFRRFPVRSRRILIPRSDLGARDALAKELRRRGARVDEVVLYETSHPEIPAARLKKALKGLDAATFTSASTVTGFFQAAQEAGLSAGSAFNGAKIIAIGPETARALKEAGMERTVLPRENWTVEGMIQAVKEAVGA
ncbi:MAG: uroporphyrinogen-III C-methyltransferase [Candidatus Omnitrophica bacterium]|nr:uroporphyrinogen-III C-methyltransferase [Candidatus Omnitrophota bacterium]